MKAKFVVTLTLPPGASARDARAYVRDAVQSMKGALKPPYHETKDGLCIGDPDDPEGDPMFLLNESTVTVTHLKETQ